MVAALRVDRREGVQGRQIAVATKVQRAQGVGRVAHLFGAGRASGSAPASSGAGSSGWIGDQEVGTQGRT